MSDKSKDFYGISNHGYGETVKTSIYSAKENIKALEIVFNQFVKEIEKSNLKLKIISLDSHPYYAQNIMKLMVDNIQKNCDLNRNIKCLKININNFKKSLKI